MLGFTFSLQPQLARLSENLIRRLKRLLVFFLSLSLLLERASAIVTFTMQAVIIRPLSSTSSSAQSEENYKSASPVVTFFRSIYQKIREYEVLDKRKTVTALRAGEDRAILLGLSMIFFSVMMYFVLGITILRSYSDSVWTDEASCTIVNSTIMWDVNCSYSCGAECWKVSRYPCLQVYVSLNSSGKVVRLLHNEETQDNNPECFYIPKCSKDYAATQAIVQNISERLRSQHTVQCFVDPTDRMDNAILTQIYGQVAVFHSLFWPTCTLIGGTLIIAMVKLTQYLSIMCERLSRIKR